MKKSVYSRPNKPMFIPVQRRNSGAIPEVREIQEPLMIDRASECHVTPADVAARMVDYLGRPGDFNTLEPSAGTGALVSALLERGYSPNEICAVERHHKLARTVRRLGVAVFERCFLEYAERVRGRVEFPRIIMNPPFSQVRRHMKAALSLLGRNGHHAPAIVVALVPITFEHKDAETIEVLSEDTFSTCRVRTKVVRIAAC